MKKRALAGLCLIGIAAPAYATSGPGRHGIIHPDAKSRPLNIPWANRWCPVTHYDGDRVTKGWVKARFVRDSDCPQSLCASNSISPVAIATLSDSAPPFIGIATRVEQAAAASSERPFPSLPMTRSVGEA